MDDKHAFGDLLAELRTLFALERNYLAEERTQLAKLRTGIAITLFVPPIYFYGFSLEASFPPFILIFLSIFLISILFWGVWMVVHAYRRIKIIRKKLLLVKFREQKIIYTNNDIENLFGNSFFFEEKKVKAQYKGLRKQEPNLPKIK